ncbi:MAG: HepT-like ribonuclease domain-containing protein [Clostridia bacterium]
MYGKLDKNNLETYNKMIGMRNRIVHEYDRISKENLWYIITEKLSDFNLFIEDYLSKNY